MSGGSYDYLFTEELEQMRWKDEIFKKMVNRLLELGYDDAARNTIEFQQMVKRYFLTMEVARDKLAPVWKAVEWADSGDTGMEPVGNAIAEYREINNHRW